MTHHGHANTANSSETVSADRRSWGESQESTSPSSILCRNRCATSGDHTQDATPVLNRVLQAPRLENDLATIALDDVLGRKLQDGNLGPNRRPGALALLILHLKCQITRRSRKIRDRLGASSCRNGRTCERQQGRKSAIVDRMGFPARRSR
jgi:hypothetical protein